MKTRFYLPSVSNRKHVELALRYHHEASEAEHKQHAWSWTRTHWFLQGVRRLILWGMAYGQSPSPHFVDSSGQRNIRIEKALSILQTEVGRLLGIDVGPLVKRSPGVGLDVVRRTAAGQAALDAFWERFDQPSFKLAMMYALAAYGTVGVGAFDVGPRAGGVFGATMMLVPPWELRPLPGAVTGIDAVSGVEWTRWVPYDWLKEYYGGQLRLPKQHKENLRLIDAPAGSKVQVAFSPAPQGQGGISGGSSTGGSPGGDTRRGDVSLRGWQEGYSSIKHVEMREFWTWGDDYSCLRWSVMLGDHLALDIDYTDEKCRLECGLGGNELPVAPLHVARYLTVGSFYGRGLVDREMDLNRELELVVGDMLQEIREFPRLRKLKLPTSAGINARSLKWDKRNGILAYNPDITVPRQTPDFLNPPHMGDLPGRTVGMISTFMDGLAAQGPMFGGQTPGRVDSAAGLDIQRQQNRVPLEATGESIAGAMSGAWKSVLSIMRRRLQPQDGSKEISLPITRVDESLLGVTFDRSTGRMSLTDNPLPQAQDVDITIRNRDPIHKALLQEQLDGLLQRNIISKVQYRITAIKEGLFERTLLNRTEYEAFVSAWLRNLVAFNDGKTPGEVVTHPEADNHVIGLWVVQQLINSPVYRLAEPPVRQRILDLKAYHVSNMGVIPDMLMAPDQFGNVGGPSPDVARIAGMGSPPQPGQTPFAEQLGPLMGGPPQ